MTEKGTWTELKNRRDDSEARRNGYPEARDAFHLGAKVRAEREQLGLA